MSAPSRQELLELERVILLRRGQSALRLMEVVDRVVEVAAGEAEAGVKEPGRMKELALAMKYLADAVDRLARLAPSSPPSPSRRTPPPSPEGPRRRSTELGELILYGDRLSPKPRPKPEQDSSAEESEGKEWSASPQRSPAGQEQGKNRTGENEEREEVSGGEPAGEDDPDGEGDPAQVFDTIDRLPAAGEVGQVPDHATIALARLRRSEITHTPPCPFASPCPLGEGCICPRGELAPRFSLLEQPEEEESDSEAEAEEEGRGRDPP